MARYIDADKADVERIDCFYGSECRLEDVREWLDEQPTADVLPIEEVERLIKQIYQNVEDILWKHKRSGMSVNLTRIYEEIECLKLRQKIREDELWKIG